VKIISGLKSLKNPLENKLNLIKSMKTKLKEK